MREANEGEIDIAPANGMHPMRASPIVRATAPKGISASSNPKRFECAAGKQPSGRKQRHLAARHVNRRTGRRAGEYFEDVLIARPA